MFGPHGDTHSVPAVRPSSADETIQLIGESAPSPRRARRLAELRDLPERVNAGDSRAALHGGVHANGQGATCGQPFRVEDATELAGPSGLAVFRTVALRLSHLAHHDTGVTHA